MTKMRFLHHQVQLTATAPRRLPRLHDRPTISQPLASKTWCQSPWHLSKISRIWRISSVHICGWQTTHWPASSGASDRSRTDCKLGL